MRFLIILSSILFINVELFSQDFLYKTSGEEIEVKVTEVGEDYLIYKKKGLENGPDFRIYLKNVFMVIFENGEKMLFNNISSKKTREKRQKKIIKNRFIFTPLYTKVNLHKGWSGELTRMSIGNVGVSYERLIGKSINKKGLEISYLYSTLDSYPRIELNSFDIAFKFYNKDKNKKKDNNWNKITSNYYYGPLIGWGFANNYRNYPYEIFISFGGKFGYSLRKGVFGANFELRFIKLNQGHQYFVDFGVMPILNF